MDPYKCKHINCGYLKEDKYCTRYEGELLIGIINSCDLVMDIPIISPKWDYCIAMLSEAVEKLRELEPPDLAYMDAYEKMIEACEEFAVGGVKMADPTENSRRMMVGALNLMVESNSEADERARLEKQYGQVWNTGELSKDFTVEGFMAPFVVAVNKETGKRGCLMFQHMPRFYFKWQEN